MRRLTAQEKVINAIAALDHLIEQIRASVDSDRLVQEASRIQRDLRA